MSTNVVERVLKSRFEFVNHLKADLVKSEEIIEEANARLEELKSTASNVEMLSKKVEHISVIPLGKNIYVNGKIIHTGEYFLDKVAYPDSYSVVETLDGTIRFLEQKIEKQSELIERSRIAKTQTEEKIRLLQGNEGDGDGEDLPKEIITDVGVAVKVGEFYEILEFEN